MEINGKKLTPYKLTLTTEWVLECREGIKIPLSQIKSVDGQAVEGCLIIRPLTNHLDPMHQGTHARIYVDNKDLVTGIDKWI